jgi:hypothetical protein
LTLLLVLEVHVEGSGVALVSVETRELGQLVAVLGIFDCTKLDDRAINLLDLLPLLRVLLLNLLEKLDETLENDALELLQESVRLKSLSGDVERKIIGYQEMSAKGGQGQDSLLTVNDDLDPARPLGESIFTEVRGDECSLDEKLDVVGFVF